MEYRFKETIVEENDTFKDNVAVENLRCAYQCNPMTGRSTNYKMSVQILNILEWLRPDNVPVIRYMASQIYEVVLTGGFDESLFKELLQDSRKRFEMDYMNYVSDHPIKNKPNVNFIIENEESINQFNEQVKSLLN